MFDLELRITDAGQDEHSCRGKNKNCMYIFCASFSHHTGGKTAFTHSLPIFTLRNDQREDSELIKPKHINHILLKFLQQTQVSVKIQVNMFTDTFPTFSCDCIWTKLIKFHECVNMGPQVRDPTTTFVSFVSIISFTICINNKTPHYI